MKTSLGIWAFGGMATRFNPGGYKPELVGVSTAAKVRTAVAGLGDNGENVAAEYAALLAAEGLLGHQHGNSGWGTFDDDAAVKRSALQWRFIDSVAAKIDVGELHKAQHTKDAVRAYELVYAALGA
jgi:hypothetical protein